MFQKNLELSEPVFRHVCRHAMYNYPRNNGTSGFFFNWSLTLKKCLSACLYVSFCASDCVFFHTSKVSRATLYFWCFQLYLDAIKIKIFNSFNEHSSIVTSQASKFYNCVLILAEKKLIFLKTQYFGPKKLDGRNFRIHLQLIQILMTPHSS